MQHAFGAKAESVPAHGGVAGKAAAKIFSRRLLDAVGDPLLECHADIDVFSRNAQRHAICLPVGRGALPPHCSIGLNI